MTLEDVQNGTAADGHGRVLWVPVIADLEHPTVEELTASGVVPLTYGLTPDGFKHETTENVITTGRYTLAQIIELAGTVKDSLDLTYVYDRVAPNATQTAVGTKGTKGNIVHQLGYPNELPIAAGQKINAILPVTTGLSRDNPPTANTELSKTAKCFVTGTVAREVTIGA